MKQSRLKLALQSGVFEWPEYGQIAVFCPRADDDLSALPKERAEIIQGFRPDYDAFAAQGYQTLTSPKGPYAASLVFLPRAKIQARALIAEAVARSTRNGLVLVDGQKTDGIDSFYRACRKRVPISQAFSKAHGKLFWFFATQVFDDWIAPPPRVLADGFRTVAGIFSADEADPGSRLLAEALPSRLSTRVADLGAGWGYLSRSILERTGVEELHLVEADHSALDCAIRNIQDRRAHFHWADVRSFEPDELFDMVVTNPPFHTTRAADPGLGRGFIAAAARMLKPGGQLWLVSNRHLPYEAEINAHFSRVEEHPGDNRFKLFHASHPKHGARKYR